MEVMKTNESLKRLKKEIKSFDYDSLARQIMKGDTRYAIIIDDDGSIYWDNALYSKVRNGKRLIMLHCPYYTEKIKSKREFASLKKELRAMLKERIKTIPDSYWL